MNRKELADNIARLKYESAEVLNRGGEAITAFLRLVLILGMVLLLGVASFLNLLDEQLASNTTTDELRGSAL